MLNQASTDRIELAKLLNISDLQLSYITNVDAGHGLDVYKRQEPEVSKPEVKNATAQTVHQQPKPKNKNVKER